MRVISQNGMIDVPYEVTAFHMAGGTIRMNMVGDTGKGTIIAQYSTLEKAEKAMQKLHKCYTGIPLMRSVSLLEDDAEQLKNMTTGFICVNSGEDNVRIEPMHIVFRFPREDEL